MRRKTYLYEKNCNVILASEFCKSEEYLSLYNHIRKHKRFTNIDVLENPELRKYVSTYDLILQQCRLEWTVDQNPSPDLLTPNKFDCSVCSAKKLVNFCRLRNRISDRIIIVGRECAKYFEEEQIKQISTAMKAGHRIRRIHSIDSYIPEFRDTLEKYKNHYRNYLLPSKIDSDLIQNYSHLKERYDKYINKQTSTSSKETYDCVNDLNKLLQERTTLESKANFYIATNHHMWNFPTPEIITWINQTATGEHAFEFKSKIRESDGLISPLTVHRIFEPKFMQTVLEKISEKLYLIEYIEKTSTTKTRDMNIALFLNKKRLTVKYNYSDFIANLGVDILYEQPIQCDFENFISDAKYDLQSYKRMLNHFIHISGAKFREIQNPGKPEDLIYRFEQQYYYFNTSNVKTSLLKLYFKDNLSKEDAFNTILNSKYKVLSEKEYQFAEELRHEITGKMT